MDVNEGKKRPTWLAWLARFLNHRQYVATFMLRFYLPLFLPHAQHPHSRWVHAVFSVPVVSCWCWQGRNPVKPIRPQLEGASWLGVQRVQLNWCFNVPCLQVDLFWCRYCHPWRSRGNLCQKPRDSWVPHSDEFNLCPQGTRCVRGSKEKLISDYIVWQLVA